jgi:hypothetical protein
MSLNEKQRPGKFPGLLAYGYVYGPYQAACGLAIGGGAISL